MAGFAVAVGARHALASGLVMSRGALVVALSSEKEEVGSAHFADFIVAAGMAVVDALLAFSIQSVVSDRALLHALILVVKHETSLADKALVEVILVALLAVSIGVAKHASVVPGSFNGPIGAGINAFAVEGKGLAFVALLAGSGF